MANREWFVEGYYTRRELIVKKRKLKGRGNEGMIKRNNNSNDSNDEEIRLII